MYMYKTTNTTLKIGNIRVSKKLHIFEERVIAMYGKEILIKYTQVCIHMYVHIYLIDLFFYPTVCLSSLKKTRRVWAIFLVCVKLRIYLSHSSFNHSVCFLFMKNHLRFFNYFFYASFYITFREKCGCSSLFFKLS